MNNVVRMPFVFSAASNANYKANEYKLRGAKGMAVIKNEEKVTFTPNAHIFATIKYFMTQYCHT